MFSIWKSLARKYNVVVSMANESNANLQTHRNYQYGIRKTAASLKEAVSFRDELLLNSKKFKTGALRGLSEEFAEKVDEVINQIEMSLDSQKK